MYGIIYKFKHHYKKIVFIITNILSIFNLMYNINISIKNTKNDYKKYNNIIIQKKPTTTIRNIQVFIPIHI